MPLLPESFIVLAIGSRRLPGHRILQPRDEQGVGCPGRRSPMGRWSVESSALVGWG